MNPAHHRILSIGLLCCVVLFLLRVMAQLLVYLIDVPLLPTFDQWYSGAISYPWLLAWQLVIALVMIYFLGRITRRKIIPSRGAGYVLYAIGLLYFIVMLIRLVIGFFQLSDITWFSRPIPSFFHLVLASYLMLVAHYHVQYDGVIND